MTELPVFQHHIPVAAPLLGDGHGTGVDIIMFPVLPHRRNMGVPAEQNVPGQYGKIQILVPMDIGADMVEYLPKWHRIDELIEMVQFVGVPRPKYKAGTSYPVIWVDVPLMDISSSAVRSYIKKDRIPNFMVPQSVLAYIKKAGLYK